MRLIHAADSGQREEVEKLIAAKEDVNQQWKKKDGRGYNPLSTPLHYAARSGHLDIVKLLLENGADINAKDVENWTALHYSCNNGHIDIVEYLLSKGIDTTPKDAFFKQTALQFARYRQFHDIVKMIDPNHPPFVRSAKDINKSGEHSVFNRNSKKFLFRYAFREDDAEQQLVAFRRNPNHAPLTLKACDAELDYLQVSIVFDHDYESHRARVLAMRSSDAHIVRISTISTNEHIIISSTL